MENTKQQYEYEDIYGEDYEDYKKLLTETYNMILKEKRSFMVDPYFSHAFKFERIQELIDFFVLEEEYEKCKELRKIREAIEIQNLLK